MPKKQMKAALILGMIILFVILLLLALMNISLFFVVLIALVVGICVLRAKKPEYFQIFAKEKAGEKTDSAQETSSVREAFSAHIVLLYHGSVTTQQILVDQPEFSIGRSTSCNFVLSGNTDISRVHAIIHYNEETGQSTVTDNNSSHGTKVNGEWLASGEVRTLHNGDIIQIEDRILTVQNKNY